MASDIDIKKPERVRMALGDFGLWLRRTFTSRLAWTIISVNLGSLLVLLAGMVAITENRRGLVDAKVDSLTAQAEIIANVITETSVTGDSPGPRMDPDGAREVLRRLSGLYVPEETRALLYAPGPARIADSDLIAGAVDESVLAPVGEADRAERALSRRLADWFSSQFLSPEERERLDRGLIEEVEAAFATGEPQTGLRRGPDGERIVSVTIPIQLIQAVVGTVTYESYDFDQLIAAERQAILPFAITAFLAIMTGALWLTGSIARPVRRLADAARAVRLAGGRRVPLPDMTKRRDEIGDMGRAFTAMTDALYDRLDAIESFAADVSHEIKNPLTSIRSAAEILPMAKDEDKRARLIGVIQHDVKRLDRLITDISNASRLDAELAREDLTDIDMDRLLGGIVSIHMQDQDEPREGMPGGVRVKLVAKDLNLHVHGHEGPLSRVFINLVENAITFSPEGGTVTVSLSRLGSPPGQIRVEVTDEGPGIPTENLETIFERFYTQRPAGSAFGSHSGLGLAIARQIITAHGGRIRASNRSDRSGARFTVDLPAMARTN
jgi:two-component system sensor histidine kinase ChvG